jgi:hypothetical protein
MKGRKQSSEHLAKLSASRKGRFSPRQAEALAKARIAWKGRGHTKEAKLKISQARSGYSHTKETKRHLSAVGTGNRNASGKRSSEFCLKMIEAAKQGWIKRRLKEHESQIKRKQYRLF